MVKQIHEIKLCGIYIMESAQIINRLEKQYYKIVGYFDAHPDRPPHPNQNFFTHSRHHATLDNSLQLTCNLICRRAVSVRNVAIPFLGLPQASRIYLESSAWLSFTAGPELDRIAMIFTKFTKHCLVQGH